MSPTARSLAKLRKDGWIVDVVERWIPGLNRRKDMMGVWDLVGCRVGGVCFVQTTTKGNMKSRINKILDHPDLDVMRRCGATLLVHGWHKKGRFWNCETADVS